MDVKNITTLPSETTLSQKLNSPGSLPWSAAEKSRASFAYFSISLSQSLKLTGTLVLPSAVTSRIVRSTISAQSNWHIHTHTTWGTYLTPRPVAWMLLKSKVTLKSTLSKEFQLRNNPRRECIRYTCHYVTTWAVCESYCYATKINGMECSELLKDGWYF